MESALAKRNQQLRRLIQSVRSQDYAYEAKAASKRDWSAYDDAQIHEIHDTLTGIRELIDEVPEPRRPGMGAPWKYTRRDLCKAILTAQYLDQSNRRAQGLALLFKEKLGLTRVPHYKAIERAYGDPRVKAMLRMAFRLTAQGASGDHTLAVDGTGLERTRKANWERDKTRTQSPQERAKDFDGSTIMMGVPSFLATAHQSVAIGFEAEAPTLPLLLAESHETLGGLGGVNVVADAAYPSRKHCSLIAKLGGTPYLFPRSNFTLAPQGSKAWRGMLDSFMMGTQAWLRAYHARSAAESFNSRHKRRHPAPLRKRLRHRRETEKHARFTVDNVTQLGYIARRALLHSPQPTH